MNILCKIKYTACLGLMLAGSTAIAQPSDPNLADRSNYGVKLDSSWKPSRTPDGAYDRVPHISQPIQWQHLREDDILWRKRVWREIDAREKQNVGFLYKGDEYTGGGMFIEILLDGIKRGKIKAYNSDADDRFTVPFYK